MHSVEVEVGYSIAVPAPQRGDWLPAHLSLVESFAVA